MAPLLSGVMGLGREKGLAAGEARAKFDRALDPRLGCEQRHVVLKSCLTSNAELD